MSQLILNGLHVNELLEQIGRLIDCRLSKASTLNNNPSQSKFISRQEVSKLLMISLPTLNDYTKLGWLNSYKLGKRVLYKQDEVLACVEKVATNKHKRGGNHGA